MKKMLENKSCSPATEILPIFQKSQTVLHLKLGHFAISICPFYIWHSLSYSPAVISNSLMYIVRAEDAGRSLLVHLTLYSLRVT